MSAEIGLLSELRILHFEDNNFSGGLPSELGFLTKMELMYIYESSVTGPIATELGTLTNLMALDLEWNDLQGLVPSELSHLTALVMLWLNDNDNLTFSLPTELRNLEQLEHLFLQGASINGTISPELTNGWTNLQVLNVSDTLISGTLPTQFCTLPVVDFDCSGSLCGCDCNC